MALDDARSRIENSRNHSRFQSGFEDDEGGGAGMDDFDFDFDFGDSDSSGGGGDSGLGGDLFGFDSPDDSGGLGDSLGGLGGGLGGGGLGGLGGGLGGSSLGGFDAFGQNSGMGGMGGAQQAKPDRMDQAIDATIASAGDTFNVVKEMIRSFRNRNADDWGMYCKNVLTTGAVFGVVGTVVFIIGLFGQIKLFRFTGLPINMILSGFLCVGTGLVGISGAAFKLLNISDTESDVDMDSLPNEDSSSEADSLFDGLDIDIDGDDGTDGFDSDFDAVLANLDSEFGEDEEDNDPLGGSVSTLLGEEEENPFESALRNREKNANFVERVPENAALVSRRLLVETFKGRLLINTPNFSQSTQYDKDDDKFQEIETKAISAYASASGKEVEDLENTYMDDLTETLFSYTLKLKRINALRVTEAKLAEEIEAYFSDIGDDPSNPDAGKVSASVSRQGDYYIISVTKSKNTSIVTLGDCFQKEEVEKFFLDDKKHMLPIVAGITDKGVPLLEDAKNYDATMIAGKQRSGKSWYVDSLVMQLQMFNLPEDVQFCYIDPKESYLFKCLSYMPHCCGLHNHHNTLEIMNDIIEKEGSRRKRLLQDNQCDTIWDLRKKGIKLPVLYLVIDEYMTVNDYYSDRSSELKSKLQVILSQLPSQGIRVLFVPHRAQGVVDKTSRALISYAAAVKCDNDIVKETLDEKKWTRRLTMPGDIALKVADKTLYVRGAALELSDEDNTILIKDIAKSFYKMGVEIPDMSSIGLGYNRDEEAIREELQIDSGTGRIQYDATRMIEELDSIDL